jgi:hypothetical protein
MKRLQTDLADKAIKVAPKDLPKVIKQPDWRDYPQPDITINEFLEKYPVEDLAKLSDAQLARMLEPYFPLARRAMLPTEKPKKIGVANRALMEAVDKNKDAINAILAARGIKLDK